VNKKLLRLLNFWTKCTYTLAKIFSPEYHLMCIDNFLFSMNFYKTNCTLEMVFISTVYSCKFSSHLDWIFTSGMSNWNVFIDQCEFSLMCSFKLFTWKVFHLSEFPCARKFDSHWILLNKLYTWKFFNLVSSQVFGQISTTIESCGTNWTLVRFLA